MIIPSGKYKRQENQGPRKYDSILDASFFKEAIGNPTFAPHQDVDPQLQQATQEGGLDAGGMYDRNRERDMGNDPATSGNAVQPNGTAKGTSPASQFFGQNPEDENQQGRLTPDQLYIQEQSKIRQFIGNDMGMKLKDNKNGTFTVVLTAPGPIANPDGFIRAFIQSIGEVIPEETETPSRSDPKGKITVTYVPQGVSARKVTKGKGR